ncbi:GNAT family N-acetyltransferase [Streptomyces sp. NPDC048644]|uniref:GNAT family N-acetyltransferase n=1 Tax=Streptomyces sp. NPDC048644 TaxID=3365582 RepID=UPI003711CF50
MLTVRGAAPADLEQIAALHARARAAHDRLRFPGVPFDEPAERARTRASWNRALTDGDARALCAERHGRVLGAAWYATGTAPGTVTLHQLQVDPAHWGTGIGGALHTACHRAWHTAGCAVASLDVVWHNHRARTFYAALGWRPDPARRPAPDATHLTLTLPVTPPADETPHPPDTPGNTPPPARVVP